MLNIRNTKTTQTIKSSKDIMLEYINKKKRVTFLDLQVYMGNIIEPDHPVSNKRVCKELIAIQEHKYRTIGDYKIKLPEPYNNIILWDGISILFYGFIRSILDDIVIYRCTKYMYKDIVCCPSLPLAYTVKEYKEPHWMHTIICPKAAKLDRLKVEVQRLNVSYMGANES